MAKEKEEVRKTRQIKYVNGRSQLFCRLFVNKISDNALIRTTDIANI